jgi:hypothetical protein
MKKIVLLSVIFLLSIIVYAAFDATSNFPGSLDDTSSLYDVANDGTISHLHHDVLADAAVKIETKIGTSASTPADNQVLTGTGSGTSAWAGVEPGMLTDSDHGPFTYSSGTATMDANSIGANALDGSMRKTFTDLITIQDSLTLDDAVLTLMGTSKIDSIGGINCDSLIMGQAIDSVVIDGDDSLKIRVSGGRWYGFSQISFTE